VVLKEKDDTPVDGGAIMDVGPACVLEIFGAVDEVRWLSAGEK